MRSRQPQIRLPERMVRGDCGSDGVRRAGRCVSWLMAFTDRGCSWAADASLAVGGREGVFPGSWRSRTVRRERLALLVGVRDGA